MNRTPKLTPSTTFQAAAQGARSQAERDSPHGVSRQWPTVLADSWQLLVPGIERIPSCSKTKEHEAGPKDAHTSPIKHSHRTIDLKDCFRSVSLHIPKRKRSGQITHETPQPHTHRHTFKLLLLLRTTHDLGLEWTATSFSLFSF